LNNYPIIAKTETITENQFMESKKIEIPKVCIFFSNTGKLATYHLRKVSSLSQFFLFRLKTMTQNLFPKSYLSQDNEEGTSFQSSKNTSAIEESK